MAPSGRSFTALLNKSSFNQATQSLTLRRVGLLRLRQCRVSRAQSALRALASFPLCCGGCRNHMGNTLCTTGVNLDINDLIRRLHHPGSGGVSCGHLCIGLSG